jgi:hypothetical protein
LLSRKTRIHTKPTSNDDHFRSSISVRSGYDDFRGQSGGAMDGTEPVVTAERQRTEAERLRQTQESARQAQEASRAHAEADRVLAETARLTASTEVNATIATLRTLLERMEAVEAMRRAARKPDAPVQ